MDLCDQTYIIKLIFISDNVNDFDQLLEFQCPNEGFITGINSFHNNDKEDRRFKFKCCGAPGKLVVIIIRGKSRFPNRMKEAFFILDEVEKKSKFTNSY